MIAQFIQERLLGQLWHTTSSERFERIQQTGFIKPEPEIPDKERFGTIRGPSNYPYVRFSAWLNSHER